MRLQKTELTLIHTPNYLGGKKRNINNALRKFQILLRPGRQKEGSFCALLAGSHIRSHWKIEPPMWKVLSPFWGTSNNLREFEKLIDDDTVRMIWNRMDLLPKPRFFPSYHLVGFSWVEVKNNFFPLNMHTNFWSNAGHVSKIFTSLTGDELIRLS